MNIGDIDIDVDAAVNSEGTFVLSGEKITGPTVLTSMETEINVNSESSSLYEDGAKKLDIAIDIYIKGTTTKVASVTVNGATELLW